MATNHANPGTSANPTTDRLTCPERDAREGTHNDSTDAQDNKPPDHGKSTNPGEPNTFLEWCHPETPVDATILQEKWQYWYPRSVDDRREPQQDRAGTWDAVKGWSE